MMSEDENSVQEQPSIKLDSSDEKTPTSKVRGISKKKKKNYIKRRRIGEIEFYSRKCLLVTLYVISFVIV